MASSQGNGQHSHFQPSPLARQNSWYSLTLDEVTNQLGDLGKTLGSMDLHELLQNIYTSEETTASSSSSSSPSLQRQASLTLAKAFVGKSVDDVWREIQQGQKKRCVVEDVKVPEREPTLGETTLEDFLVQAGLFAQASPKPLAEGSNPIDTRTPMCHPHKFGVVSPPPSIGALFDRSTPGRKRDDQDPYEKTIDRRLRRKIKNRESAARSRARKQVFVLLYVPSIPF